MPDKAKLAQEQSTRGLLAARSTSWQAPHHWQPQHDELVVETPVALVFNDVSHAVLMATPIDLADLALGFSLSEGIISDPAQLFSVVEESADPSGIRLEIHIHGAQMQQLRQVHRYMAGPTGCGLCGKATLAAVQQQLSPMPFSEPPAAEILNAAVQALPDWQPIQRQAGACHAAAWCDAQGNVHCVREDVGRHNALDKLIGAARRAELDLSTGFVVMSSRASYELVYKSVRAGIRTLVTVSGATSLAVTMAQQSHLHLFGFARQDRLVRYTPEHEFASNESSEP
jgi:FdhD protein